MSSDIAIKVNNLTKTYRLYNSPIDRIKEAINPFKKTYHHDFFALDDISFEVKKGECLGLLGLNGSGKSTLLKIISGVLTPTSGSINVKGKIAALLELGAGFNPELTGIENIYLAGTINGRSREEIDSSLADVLAFADIGEFVNQPVKTYSSGMFVRLAFAVAINIEPDVLIVDEALAVGDMMFQRKCKAKMNEFKDNGVTILLVSHAMADIRALCNSAIFLSNGRISYAGSPHDAIMAYTHDRNLKEKKYFSGSVVSPSVSEIPKSYEGDIGGTGEIIINNVVCYQKYRNKEDSIIEYGETIVVEISYKINCKISKPVFRVGLSVVDFNFFANFDSIDCGLILPCLDDDGTVTLEIQNPNLYPRTYAINVAVVTEVISSHLFYWNKAAVFIIKAKDKVHMLHPRAIVQLKGAMSLNTVKD